MSLKNKPFILAVIIFLASSHSYVRSQTLSFIDSIAIPEPQCVSIDQRNNIYIADKKGSVRKYSPANKLLLEYSPPKSGQLALLEAWNPLRIFVFYENFQEYLFLDRFLTAGNRFDVQSITEYAGLITTSSDNNLWVIDQADFGLKKYNISFGQLTVETSFDLLLDREKYDINFIREYQNMVFVADKNFGILVFDNLGNYSYTLPFKNISHFGFYENEIYFIQGPEVMFVNIYNQKENWVIKLDESPIYVLYANNRLWTFLKKHLKTYKVHQ